jgi:hypothetical protein
MICTPTKYYLGDQIEKNEIDGACRKKKKKEGCIQVFGGEL